MSAEAERVESMQADANVLVIGIISHKKGAQLKHDTNIRDQNRVSALKKEFNSVFTMTHEGDDNVFDKVHHLKHAMNKNGASALIKHLDGLKIAAKFDFICLEFVRMPSAYYTKFVTGDPDNNNPGLPLVEFLCHLRDCNKLKSGCKCLFASVKEKSYRWLEAIQLLEKHFGRARDVEATENPYYRACAAAARSSDRYNYVEALKSKNEYEKPFAEYTVLPVSKDNELSSPLNVTNPLSEDHDEESDSELVLDTMLRDMGSGSPFNVTNPLSDEESDSDPAPDTLLRNCEVNDFDMEAMHRDLMDKLRDEDHAVRDEDSDFDEDSDSDEDSDFDADAVRDEDSDLDVDAGGGAITIPKMAGAASVPQSTELIQKVAERIANGESYRTACEVLDFNLNENKEYKGSYTAEYRRLQFQVRKAKEAKKEKGEQDLAKLNEELVKQLETVTSQLQDVTCKYRVLQQKLNKCECEVHEKGRLFIYN